MNGIRLHYITAGTGPALLLLHGTPKDSFYWYKVFPLLTEHFTIVAPDLRGFGYTDKPPTTDGYDSVTNADDAYAGVSRNAECPCGSGKKYKKCHGANQ